MGIPLRAGYFSHTPTIQKIKNTSGTGLVGYQITVHVWVVDADNPYVRMEAQYILRPDGSRQFLTNNVCKNGICLNS